MEFQDADPTVVPAGEGTTYRTFGETLTLKLGTDDTGGAFTLFECLTPPQVGPPLHAHHREDETIYVLEGDYEVQCGEGHFKIHPGMLVFLPRDIPHAHRNSGHKPARMLVWATPSGVESFVRELGQIPTESQPDQAKLIKLGRRFGIEFAGTPLWHKPARS